jgi:RecA-family ATPase
MTTLNLDENLAAYLDNPVESQLLGLNEVINRQPPEYLIDGILSQRSLAVLFGKWGSGKSFVALDWAMDIGLGWPWQGREVRQGPVIYVTAEGAAGIGRRVRAWLDHYGSDELPSVSLYPDVLNLLNPAQVELLAKVVLRNGVRLVVFDTLNRSMVGGDENSSVHMGQVVAAAQKIQQAGAAVLLVHHRGHMGREPRGHSSLPGAADHMITTWRPEDANGQYTDDGFFMLYSHKQKEDEPFKPVRLRLRRVNLEQGSSAVVEAA